MISWHTHRKWVSILRGGDPGEIKASVQYDRILKADRRVSQQDIARNKGGNILLFGTRREEVADVSPPARNKAVFFQTRRSAMTSIQRIFRDLDLNLDPAALLPGLR